MRHARTFPWLTGLVLLMGLAGPAAAQRTKLVVTRADVGLPPGRFVSERTDSQKAAPVFKSQSWAPIYLDLELKAKVPGPAFVRVETTDDDDLKTTLTVPLGNLSDRNPGEIVRADELPFIPYVRSGDDTGGQVTLTILDEDGSVIADTVQKRYLRARDKSTYVVLSLGSNLPGFDLPDPKGQSPEAPDGGRGPLRGGRVETAAITNLRQMPDRWLGYDSVDLCVIGTGAAADEFLAELFSDSPANETRRTALLEWVRRGGRLLVTVGANAQLLSQYPVFAELLPRPFVRDEPGRQVPNLTLVWRPPGRADQRSQLQGKAGNTFPIAQFDDSADAPGRVLLRNVRVGRGDDDSDYPLVVQKAYGLGRITVAAIDLDRSPFLDLEPEVRSSFWDWLVREAGDARSAAGSDRRRNEYGYGYNTDTEDGFGRALKEHVDDFQDVPVISFGWVALFIALYTLLIGPVEYLFLKKIVGRLELTWITFPLIVLSVSTAAYFTAYAIKGDDLRINKVDVIDIDPDSGRVYGRSWFTIFSPRIDSYTIGIEPRPEWAGGRPNVPTPPTRVDWMGGGQVGGGNIVSRGYEYHTDAGDREYADGLDGVPIQVWSTKAFAADWSAWMTPGEPLVESQLFHPPGDPEALSGKIVNRLPLGRLDNAYLAYAGNVYDLGTLAPGASVTPALGRDKIATEWLRTNASLSGIGSDGNESYNNYGNNTSSVRFRDLSLWGMLFYEKAAAKQGNTNLQNASFRNLDQSWRLADDYRDQAILLARVTAVKGPAEDLMTGPDAPSPTTLWLRDLPGSGEARTPVPGTLRQETYIRVYLPIAGRGPRPE